MNAIPDLSENSVLDTLPLASTYPSKNPEHPDALVKRGGHKKYSAKKQAELDTAKNSGAGTGARDGEEDGDGEEEAVAEEGNVEMEAEGEGEGEDGDKVTDTAKGREDDDAAPQLEA